MLNDEVFMFLKLILPKKMNKKHVKIGKKLKPERSLATYGDVRIVNVGTLTAWESRRTSINPFKNRQIKAGLKTQNNKDKCTKAGNVE